MKKRYISLLVSFGLLALLIYFSDVGKIAEVLSRANLFYIFIGLFIWLVNAVLRTARWQYLLEKIDIRIKFFQIMKVFIAGLFISNITPGKTGDPIRSIILKKVQGSKVSKTLPSIIFERVFDVLTTVLISLLGVFALFPQLSQISFWVSIAIIFYILAFSTALYIITSEHRTKTALSKIYSIFSFISKINKFKNRINSFSKNLYTSFQNYKSKRTVLVTLSYSVVIWLLEGVTLFIAFKALGLEVTLLSTIVIVPIAALISILTFLPGGIGSAEIITVLFFTSLFPLTLAEVTATALLGRLLSFWIYAALGSVLLSTFKYKYKV